MNTAAVIENFITSGESKLIDLLPNIHATIPLTFKRLLHLQRIIITYNLFFTALSLTVNDYAITNIALFLKLVRHMVLIKIFDKDYSPKDSDSNSSPADTVILDSDDDLSD